jgi:histidyl-tRNA synthetase
MANSTFQSLPGFRDFLPKDFAVRQYLHEIWRATARRYGFVEYETPILEETALYLKKSGGELSTQLFRFQDQGERDVTLRPEVTASLARLVAANQREFPKPLKWFEIGQCFRYEKPQKGRGREFFQFNADILGESSSAADAELVSLAIDTMLAFGFGKEDFCVRVSDRQAWANFASQKNISEDQFSVFLQIVDKLERDKPEAIEMKLSPMNVTLNEVKEFISDSANASENYRELQLNLTARGVGDYIQWDLSIVRGLAYYTGIVFEVFDKKVSMRAVAGGGRYDALISTITDQSVDLPATGFAMGDYVIKNLIEEVPNAFIRLEGWLQKNAPSCDVYVVITDESKREQALWMISALRQVGIKVDFPLSPMKINKQFPRADQSGARFAVIIGDKYPSIPCKNLSTRREFIFEGKSLVIEISQLLQESDYPLIA